MKEERLNEGEITSADFRPEPGTELYLRNWQDTLKQPPPPGYPRFGVMEEVSQQTKKLVRADIGTLANHEGELAPHEHAARTLYLSGLANQEAAAETDGQKILRQLFAKIEAIATPDSIAATLGQLHREGIFGFSSFSVQPDPATGSHYMLRLVQDGLSLGDESQYRGAGAAERLADFERFIPIMASRIDNFTISSEEAQQVVALETTLAAAHNTKEANRDPVKTYNRHTFAELQTDYAAVNWEAYCEGLGIETPSDIIVDQPKAFSSINRILATTPLEVIKNYLRVRAALTIAPFMGEETVETHFSFFGRSLQGIQENLDRRERATQYAQTYVPHAFGRMFAEKHLDPTVTQRLQGMLPYMLRVARELVDDSPFSEGQKEINRQKLARLKIDIGIPDSYDTYEGVDLSSGYVSSIQSARQHGIRERLARIGQALDRTRWPLDHSVDREGGYSPAQMNLLAYLEENRIIVLAGFLQSPIIRPDMTVAELFAALTPVAHELTHHLGDDQGLQYNEYGQLNREVPSIKVTDMSPDRRKIRIKALRIGRYATRMGLGKQTVGEIAGDLGGMQINFHAMQLYLAEHPEQRTPDAIRQFALGCMALYRTRHTPEDLKNYLKSNMHPPAPMRALFVWHIPEIRADHGMPPERLQEGNILPFGKQEQTAS